MAEPILKLKLLVDKKKNKVVLAEAAKDFVDVLLSFLALPMGTIVRLVDKYQQEKKSQAVTIGCFNNVYTSVVDLNTSSFMTEACKEMLLYPRSQRENQHRKLKLNIDDTDVLKYYRCSSDAGWCKETYSNFCSSRCNCGALMSTEFKTYPRVGSGVAYASHKTFFTITDNMRVKFTTTGFTLKILKELGYTDVDQLHEMIVDVNLEKVLALMSCLYSSETPLTDVFLMKGSSSDIRRVQNMPSPPSERKIGGETESNELLSVSVFTRKLEKKVLYVESGKDFVDLLFTFLILPLNSAWQMSGGPMVQGCIGNLCESFKTLSSNTCILPWYYSCQPILLDVSYARRDSDRDFTLKSGSYHSCLKAMDPRCNFYARSILCNGFVKEGATFMISDDLVITPMNVSLTISTLKKWNMDLDDLEGQTISISKAEAIELLRASFMTSAALSTAFGSLLQRKSKEGKL